MQLSIIEIKDLTFRYSGIKVVDNLNLTVNKNDFLGIIGTNGSGKTTMFFCMLGLLGNYDGTISFFGQDIKKSKEYLQHIGYVPQKPIFEKNFPATVREVVRMALPKGSDESMVDSALQDVMMHELDQKRIGELSGGQQQRVFIAKALVNNPKILILDEPVTGVDVHSTEMFYGILRGLHQHHDITILWSSHDLDAVSALSTKVACMNRSLFFHGDADEFFTNEKLVKQYSEASMQEHMHHH